MKLDKTTQSGATPGSTNIALQAFGHILFMPMSGWPMQRYTNAIVFKPANLAANRYLETRIMEPKPFSGSLQEAWQNSWNDVLKEFHFVSPYSRAYDIIKKKIFQRMGLYPGTRNSKKNGRPQ